MKDSLYLLYGLILGCALFSTQAFAVYQAVFNIKDMNGKLIVSEKDLKCVSIDEDNVVTFVLKDSAARHLHDYSVQNLNKNVWVSICAVPPRKTLIETQIPGGIFEYSSLTRYQLKCIRESFNIQKSCKPVEF